MQILEGQLRFGIHAGQQNTDFPSYLAMWRKAEDLGLDWASLFDPSCPSSPIPRGRASRRRPLNAQPKSLPPSGASGSRA
ncbi:MAG: hypothetical protein ACRDHS_01795 [Actinomycetota bacterium]